MDFITEIIKTHGRNAKSGLEIASGSGQHIISFAQEMPQIKWTPSEIKDDALASISEYITDSGLTNISPPKRVDCLERSWELDRYDIIANINMIHISPYNACEGLMMLAGKYLNPGGVLCLYGPFFKKNEATAPSNLKFNDWLKNQDNSWGVRNLEDVIETANSHGMAFERELPMPANNLTIIFRKTGGE